MRSFIVTIVLLQMFKFEYLIIALRLRALADYLAMLQLPTLQKLSLQEILAL